MALTSPFQCRRTHSSASEQAQPCSALSRSVGGRGLPFLWPWAANANRSKLRGITLAHVLSGDTVSPISLSDFEAFLTFCDISLENLHFIVWYQDYRARFEALSVKDETPSSFVPEKLHTTSSRGTFRSMKGSHNQQDSSVESDGNREDAAPDFHSMASKNHSGTDFSTSYPTGSHTSSHNGGFEISSVDSFRKEIHNILATFFVPGARKELSLSSEMRENVIKVSSRTTHPDVFFPVYETIYETVECVSLPRFLENASTNINRPRQLFWYSCALPTFLLGVALVLLFILSPSQRFVLPPQSHRLWRLLSVPCFLLSSMMWYKGFRGFCPILFLRSSRQLRPWELEHMVDDKEAQAYCVSLSNRPAVQTEDVHGLPTTPTSPIYSSSPVTRIAPFLDDINTDTTKKAHQTEPISVSSSRSTLADAAKGNQSADEQPHPRACNEFHRPAVFGPGRVVEDKRIRSVHMQLWWSLVRFGLFWAIVSAIIVVSVPSLH